MKTSNYKILILGIIIFISGCSLSATQEESWIYYSKIMRLTNSYVLKIEESTYGILTFDLFQNSILIKSIPIENSTMNDEMIELTHFDSKGGKYYFITAYDRSSTYGATSNIVVWESGSHWDMILTPCVYGRIEDRDNDGVFEIIDEFSSERIYKFENGVFSEYEY